MISTCSQLSAAEVAKIVKGMGEAYAEYEAGIIKNNINGSMLVVDLPEDEIAETFDLIGVKSKVHKRLIVNHFTELSKSKSATTEKAKKKSPTAANNISAPAPPPPHSGGDVDSSTRPLSLTYCSLPPALAHLIPQFQGSKSHNEIIALLVEKTDVFLTHNCGSGPHCENHSLVGRINDALQKKNIRTWFDGQRIQGNIPSQMTREIDNARIVIAFITKDYIDKVRQTANPNDNCKLEFMYAVSKQTPSNILTVVMEPGVRNTKTWDGEVGSHLGSHLFFDFASWNESNFNSTIEDLYSQILVKLGGTPINVALHNLGFDGVSTNDSSSAAAASSSSSPFLSSSLAACLTSSFSESITLRRRPTLSIFGADNGVLSNGFILGMCFCSGSSGVGIVGGEEAGTRSAQSNSTVSDSILFVCDKSNKRIQVMNASSGALISTIGRAGQLDNPWGICLYTSTNTPELFVADAGKHIVQVFDTHTGTPLRSYGTTGQHGSATNQLYGPIAVCIGSMTTRATASDPLCLFVSDNGNRRIQVMNASTGAFIKTIGGGQGSGPGQMSSPVGVCLLPDTINPGSGNLLFVADNGNHRVSVFNVLTGAFVRTIGVGKGSNPGQLFGPSGIYVLPAGASAANSKSDPMIFIADYSNNRVCIFNATSCTLIRSIDVGYHTKFALPAVSSDGEAFMYVSTEGGHVKILPL